MTATLINIDNIRQKYALEIIEQIYKVQIDTRVYIYVA